MNFLALYEHVTLWIGDGTGATDTLLHVHAGLAVLFLARLVTRYSLATPVPFLIVCVAELANEYMDYLSYGSLRGVDTALDIVNTLFWPFMLMVGLRLSRARDSFAPRGDPGFSRAR